MKAGLFNDQRQGFKSLYTAKSYGVPVDQFNRLSPNSALPLLKQVSMTKCYIVKFLPFFPEKLCNKVQTILEIFSPN